MKKPAEVQKLREIASQHINKAKEVKARLQSVQEQIANKWSAPPITKVVSTQAVVAKVNEELQPDEFMVLVSESAGLKAAKLKSLKIKITERGEGEKGGKELVSHYFFPSNDEEMVATLTIPQAIMGKFRSQKLTVAGKEKTWLGVGEQNKFKHEVALLGLGSSNEVVKTIKHEDIKFEVTVRVRQAYSKKEMETKTSTKVALEKMFMPFDEYAAAHPTEAPKVEPVPQVQQPQRPAENPMLTIAKEVRAQNPVPAPVPQPKP